MLIDLSRLYKRIRLDDLHKPKRLHKRNRYKQNSILY